MRVLAIGDIHGCTVALDRLLATVNLQPSDQIITLGDYVNKGPDSKGTVDRLLALHQTGQLIPLRGNHELKLLAATSGQPFGANGEALVDPKTLASYGSTDAGAIMPAVPTEHCDFIQHHCVSWWETEQFFFVHATVDPMKSLADQSDQALFWDKLDEPAPHYSGKTMICGHTRQRSGNPLNIGHAICIDTWACGEGWLTCLDVLSGRVWQANQQGQVQTAWIDAFRVTTV